VDTLPPSVPPSPDGEELTPPTEFPPVEAGEALVVAARRRRRRWPYITLGVGVVLVLAAIAALIFVRVPYVTIGPGSATPTEHLVSVEGAPVYPADGEVLFTTVSVNAHVQLWRALKGWLDPDTDVRPEEKILGDRTPEENRTHNLALMDDSKLVAVQVALEHLGYDVTGHGVLVDPVSGTDAFEKLQPGDVITEIDGQPIEFGRYLREVL
jgi:PDZ domain-containing protein